MIFKKTTTADDILQTVSKAYDDRQKELQACREKLTAAENAIAAAEEAKTAAIEADDSAAFARAKEAIAAAENEKELAQCRLEIQEKKSFIPEDEAKDILQQLRDDLHAQDVEAAKKFVALVDEIAAMIGAADANAAKTAKIYARVSGMLGIDDLKGEQILRDQRHGIYHLEAYRCYASSSVCLEKLHAAQDIRLKKLAREG